MVFFSSSFNTFHLSVRKRGGISKERIKNMLPNIMYSKPVSIARKFAEIKQHTCIIRRPFTNGDHSGAPCVIKNATLPKSLQNMSVKSSNVRVTILYASIIGILAPRAKKTRYLSQTWNNTMLSALMLTMQAKGNYQSRGVP